MRKTEPRPEACFRVHGQVVDARTGEGLEGLRVDVLDRDRLRDDRLGSVLTDAEGRFELRYEAADFRTLFFEARPDLYLRVATPEGRLLHTTEDRVMAHRDHDRPYHVAFQSKVGPAEWLTPSTPDKLKELAEGGEKAVLIIPVAFVTDHIETSYELDMEVREEAEEFGIQYYEVTAGLNCHPLFIEALAEATAAQLRLPERAAPAASGDGVPATDAYPLRPLDQLPRFHPSTRCTRCHQCQFITEARRWDVDVDAGADVRRTRAS